MRPVNTPPTDAMLRPATAYETVAALLHHQPAAAFASLFVLYGYGHDLCPNVVVADLSEIDTQVRGMGVQRQYQLDKVTLKPLQSDRVIDLSGDSLAFHCFAQCSIRQFPVFFLCRDPSQLPMLEQLMPQVVGYATVRFNDWRLENAYEWSLISRGALAGTLIPQLDFTLMDAVGWRLIRPVTELGGRSPVLEWHLMKVVDFTLPSALPLMTVLTDPHGQILRRADAQMLTVFRAQRPRIAPVTVALAADRDPLVLVTANTRGSADASTVASFPASGATTPIQGDKVVPLQRMTG